MPQLGETHCAGSAGRKLRATRGLGDGPGPPLAIVGIAYGVLLQQNYPYNGSELVFRVLCVLGLASVICLVGFAGLLTRYRKELSRLRKEARQSVARLLESRVGRPQIPTLPSSQRVFDDRGAFQGAMKVSGAAGSPSLI